MTAYDEGGQAYLDGFDLMDCLYDDDRHADWRDGWMAARNCTSLAHWKEAQR